ncbi:chitin synthase chs-2-like [Labrus mixtus]|uniref:chitin synthase chs-2-like n=1 Tax=Labrus mixtus TaxID=508554 RepID=UPI0029C03290|nr:chitin synthase chs-2-like [Labrus mixtus]
MEEDRNMPKRPWDTCREVPVIEDEQTPWKMIKLLKIITLIVIAIIVFGLALCSKASFLLLITLANEGTKTIQDDHKPVVLLCIGCSLITSSVILFMKSLWKACYKTSKLPRKETFALVMFMEFMASGGAAILTIVAMPHLDIVTNVTILNSVAILPAILQVVTQCTAKERNRFLLPSITAFILILLGYILFLVLYIMKDPTDINMITWVGLAVGGSFLVSFNWWENYLRPIGENSKSLVLRNLCRDISKCRNILHILSSLLRIAVTACVLGAYVPLNKMEWDVVRFIPRRETTIIGIIIGVQLISSALCHWFSLLSCKMHAMRRCFILPLYLASLAVMALLVIPVIVYYQDYKTSLNGTSINFTSYCDVVVDARNQTLNGSVFPHLVLDVTHTLCLADMSRLWDISILTGSAVSWWLGLLLATIHLWHLSIYRIQRTQDLFIRRLYEGAFIEQSLLLNTRFDIRTRRKRQDKQMESSMLYLCATMWHETYDEMTNIIISIFRLDKYRPRTEQKFDDFTFEAHIYFDDAFKQVEGSRGRHLNDYAKSLVEVLAEVYSIFTSIDDKFFIKKQQIPEQKVIRTPYGGRLVVTMPNGNNIIAHFKDKELIRHKKRWSQIMYLYYLLGWKLMTKYYKRWEKGEDDSVLKAEVKREKQNTYLLALDGDTDFQPAAVMYLIDRLKMYPRVGAACGRIHPTGSGPAVWFQKFEYAVSHWLQKTAEHVIGCVLCSPGCFSLFRAEALMDDNVMKRYATKSMEASHYIQYDQGEDRWLCTLLLKQGWRVEYNAASDAYTNAPEDFKELYNQRRRWGPSTMANVVDLLGSSTIISKRNPSMSKPFMFYQLFNITSAILAPATICLLIAGSLSFVLNMDGSWALILAVIPPIIYLILCFKLKSDTQITIAGIMSIIYAFLMLVVTMSIIGAMVRDKTILTPSSIFVVSMGIIYITTAVLHPQEIQLVFHGFLYIVCIPSAYLLLTIYSMVNMNNVSWGTRESKPAPGATPAEVAKPQTKTQKAKSFFQRIMSCGKCCKKPSESHEDRQLNANLNQENLIPEPPLNEAPPMNTFVGDIGTLEEEQMQMGAACPPQCWVSQLQNASRDMPLQEDSLDKDEEGFWRELQKKYLEPLADDKERQKQIINDLRELRNKINFAFFILNALWLVATFTLQRFGAFIFIVLPKVDFNLNNTGEDVQIDPIGFMFILGFATSVLIQFFAMMYHRIYTLVHYVAFIDTEPREQKPDEYYPPAKKIEAASKEEGDLDSISDISQADSELWSEGEESDDDEEYPPPSYIRSRANDGTMV